MSKGVNRGASMVDMAVIVTDKARFAFARYEITLDAIPLGEQPIKIIPAAISGGKCVRLARVNPSNGIITK